MSEEQEPHECEECGKDCEVLTSKGAFLGNKDTRDLCDDCYKQVHQEDVNG